MNFVVLFCLPLLVSSILRGDETQKLHDERVRVREQMESHAEGSEEHTLLKRKFHLLQHKVRALDLFEHGMSQQEYDELIRLVERRDELQARHDRDNFDPTERLEFNEVSHKIKDIMDKYKQIRKQNYANDPEIKAERDKVVELRKRIAETNDRDEMMVRTLITVYEVDLDLCNYHYVVCVSVTVSSFLFPSYINNCRP